MSNVFILRDAIIKTVKKEPLNELEQSEYDLYLERCKLNDKPVEEKETEIMGIDITQLKLLAAILAQAVLVKEGEWWVLKFGNTYSKGSKLNKVSEGLLSDGLIEQGISDWYIVSKGGYGKLRRMEIE